MAPLRHFGKDPCSKLLLIQFASMSPSSVMEFRRMFVGIPSFPLLGFLARVLHTSVTSSVVVGNKNMLSRYDPVRNDLGSLSVSGMVAACVSPTAA